MAAPGAEVNGRNATDLRPGDRVLVGGRTSYEVVATPRRMASRPLMIVARQPGGNARNLQVGAVRMTFGGPASSAGPRSMSGSA